jgi:hypothetical protein
MVAIGESTKARTSISSRPAGKHIDFNDEQPAKDFTAIRRSLLFGSNVKLSIELPEKPPTDNSSTEDGMQIDFSDRQSRNAWGSI